jgi:mannose-1-phosphate guanylyltransferase
MRYAMIMAGGAGTRLWPMSREGRPKQLLKFIGRGAQARCLLELAQERLAGFVPPEHAFICTSESYRAAIHATIPGIADDQILGEPVGRDTLNAVGLAAAVFQKMDPDAVFAVLTSDHIIEPVAKFQELLDLGFRLVEADPSRLVTFSIKPTHAATQFGYVERGTPIIDVPGSKDLAFRVARFVEKPDLPRAQAYVQSGVFGWNSGMFVWKAATVLECIKQYKPESYEGLLRIQDAWGTPRQREVLDAVYPTLPKISVDYAVMEPASKVRGEARRVTVCTVLMDLKWLDVGSWPSYGQTLPADSGGNRVSGTATMVKSSGNLVVSDDPRHTIALLGCKDMIVVRTPEATLIMPREAAQDLKDLHGAVDARLR